MRKWMQQWIESSFDGHCIGMCACGFRTPGLPTPNDAWDALDAHRRDKRDTHGVTQPEPREEPE